jgi:hypothetical protein
MISRFKKKYFFKFEFKISLMKTQIKQKIDDKHILHLFSFDEPTLSYYISDVFIIISQTQIIGTWATKVIHTCYFLSEKRSDGT